MANPKLFIGSSKASLGVAKLVADTLEDDGCADVRVWDEGIFSLNQGYLEKLLDILNEFDFAVLIWAPDDVTESKAESKASPRDNVIFECGLFMGSLGRDRVFIVYDQSIGLKIPSDLMGVSLASYDGARVASDGRSAVRRSCDLIKREIQRPRFPEIIGTWRSRYPLTSDPGHPAVMEDVELKPSRGGISITSKDNPEGDEYIAHGRIFHDKQIIGDWKSKPGFGGAQGLFLLTVHPRGTLIYGYFTGPDEKNGTVYARWVLAKNDGVEAQISKWLSLGEKLLNDTTWGPAID